MRFRSRRRTKLDDEELRKKLAEAVWNPQPVEPISPASFNPTGRMAYENAMLRFDVVREVEKAMEAQSINHAQLGALMGVSEGRVYQMLGDRDQLTLRSLAALSVALKTSFTITARPWESEAPTSEQVLSSDC